jgi:hypothetical protein
VDWDEEEEEEEEQEEEEEEQDRQRRQERELYQWQTETMAPLQKTLEEYWTTDTTTDGMAQKEEEGNTKGLEQTLQNNRLTKRCLCWITHPSLRHPYLPIISAPVPSPINPTWSDTPGIPTRLHPCN